MTDNRYNSWPTLPQPGIPREGDHVCLIDLPDTAGYVVKINESRMIVRVDTGTTRYWASPSHLDLLPT